jgi:hypothetical protein
MKIILSENNLSTFLTAMLNEADNVYTNKIEVSLESLKKLLERSGIIMVDILKGKEYIVYELPNLETMIGKKYVVCRLIKDSKPYGQLMVKPMAEFKYKNY